MIRKHGHSPDHKWAKYTGDCAIAERIAAFCRFTLIRPGPSNVHLARGTVPPTSRPGMGMGEDLLQATITVRNESEQPQQVELTFESSVQPVPATTACADYG